MSTQKGSLMLFSPAQCRAARAYLDWSQDELATRSNVARKTIVDFERGAQTPTIQTAAALRAAMSDAGIKFIPENGGGDGVQGLRAIPRIVGKTTYRSTNRLIELDVQYRNRRYDVVLAQEALDLIEQSDRTPREKTEAAQALILARAAVAIDCGRAGDAMRVILTDADFQASVSPNETKRELYRLMLLRDQAQQQLSGLDYGPLESIDTGEPLLSETGALKVELRKKIVAASKAIDDLNNGYSDA
jgi:DNA-binding XRE family transcriptional regulator